MTVKLQGGLGNQMFQYAYGISKQCYKFDTSSFDNDTLRHYELDQYNLPITLVKDPNAEAGYWQDEKYFSAPIVRQFFRTPHGGPNFECSQMAERIIRAKDSCFIGVRRADYLWPERINYHGVMPEDYYLLAILQLPMNIDREYFVFTDDIPWASENLIPGAIIVDVNGPNEKAWDIWLMSLCKHAILANSSFHWWGAYLGADVNSGTIIAPKRWYADEKVNAECTTVPSRWITI